MNELNSLLSSDFIARFATPLRILLILILAIVAQGLTQRVLPHFREFIASRQSSVDDIQRTRTLSRVLRYTLTVSISAVAFILILGEFGLSVAPLLGAAGVAGLAVGFGAQSLVKDYFTGFFLLLENQIRIGDVVEAGGKTGGVEELTLRYLRLRDYDGRVHYIPNSQITVVTNMSLGFAYSVIDIGVAYGDRVVELMTRTGDAMQQSEAFSAKILAPIEIAGVEQWADSAVIIRCRFRVLAGEQWGVRREYLRRAKQAFDREGIEIPFPHLKIISPASTPQGPAST